MWIRRNVLCKHQLTTQLRIEIFKLHILKDDDREGKPLEQLTEAEDLKAYVKSTAAYNTISDLEGAHVVQRRQMKFLTPTGETPINFDELKHSANRLESLQYNIPLYVQGAADPHEDIAAMQDVSP